jgi:RND family efflux transporter MFP subunit
MKSLKWIIWLGLPVLLGSTLVIGCGKSSLAPPLPISVRTLALREDEVSSEMRFSATVREWQRIELSFKVPGTVESLLQVADGEGTLRDLHEGDIVMSDSGQPLAKLDDSDYRRKQTAAQDKLAAAEAQKRAAEANVTAVRATFERIKSLRESESVSEQTYDETLGKRDAAEAQLDAAERTVGEASVALQQADDDLKNTSLVSPLPKAVVSRKNIETGERVQAGHPIMQIMDLSRVRVAFGVSDAKLNLLKIGMEVAVTADAFPGERYQGQITKIMPAADLRTRTFEVEMTIDEPKGLKPGMVVTILVGKSKKMLLVPMTAVQRGKNCDDCVVFAVVEEGGKTVVRRRNVLLDGVFDNRVRIIEGKGSEVRAGDVIVATGAFRLTDGQEVRLLEAKETSLRIDM